jgi:hypothetical protein
MNMAWWKRKKKSNIIPGKVDSVPVLEAGDFCRGTLHDNQADQSCLLGWLEDTFGDYGAKHHGRQVDMVILETIKECFPGLQNDYGSPITSVAEFNDLLVPGNGPAIPNGALAGVWNRAMAKLGFVVGNPEVYAKTGELL